MVEADAEGDDGVAVLLKMTADQWCGVVWCGVLTAGRIGIRREKFVGPYSPSPSIC